MSLYLDADLRSIFSWNTKQLFVYLQAEYSTPQNHLNEVVLWDQIVQRKEEAHLAVGAAAAWLAG
jgi:signal peptidase complex subunit 3